MQLEHRLRDYFLHDLWVAERSARGPLGRLRDGVLRLVVSIVWALQDAELNLRAMSLVYTTLLSLVPMLAVTFSVLKAFGAHYRIEPLLGHALQPLGSTGSEITSRIVQFVDNLQVGVLGAVGLAGLFFTVLSLLGKIEDAVNHIWRVKHARGLARKFSDYMSIVLVGPVLVFTALAILASAQSHSLVQRLMRIAPVEWAVLFTATQVMPLVLLGAAFTFLYRFVPHTRVALGSAAVGGITAAVLWQLAGIGFTKFIASSTQYAAIYSSFAILIVFLIWLYYAWLVVLVGAQVAYANQYPPAYLAGRRRHGHLHRERIVLALLVEVARRHLNRQPALPLAELSATLDAPLPTVDDLVDDLVRAQILLRASTPPGIALARPPETVTVVEVLDIVRDPAGVDAMPAGDAGRDYLSYVLRRRDRAVQDALGAITLRTLASEAPPLEAVASPRSSARSS